MANMKKKTCELLVIIFILFVSNYSFQFVLADAPGLPIREGARPETTSGVPHVQIGVKANNTIKKKLLWNVKKIPFLEIRATVISLPGALGFWVQDDLPLVHPEIIVGGREFAHMHPDGSLHIALEYNRAIEAVEAGWAVRHPWADQRKNWKGFVMLYAPTSERELDIVLQLIMESFDYITGKSIQPIIEN